MWSEVYRLGWAHKMAQLPVVQNLQTQDFPTQQSWISPLIYILNLVFGNIYAALSNGLTIAQNSVAQISTVSISAVSAAYYAAPPTTYARETTSQVIRIPWKFKSRPVGCVVINLIDITSAPVPVTSAVSIDWTYSGSNVVINSITGLNALKTYSCTFYVIGG